MKNIKEFMQELMTAAEMRKKAQAFWKKNAWEGDGAYYHVGIRFEDKERQVGDCCECSRHNDSREDEREFPEYGTPEYAEMLELGGTSAWNLSTYDDWGESSQFGAKHCYVIAGNYITNTDDGLDDGEIVIQDAVVVGKIF